MNNMCVNNMCMNNMCMINMCIINMCMINMCIINMCIINIVFFAVSRRNIITMLTSELGPHLRQENEMKVCVDIISDLLVTLNRTDVVSAFQTLFS
jgi:hypothetical protein